MAAVRGSRPSQPRDRRPARPFSATCRPKPIGRRIEGLRRPPCPVAAERASPCASRTGAHPHPGLAGMPGWRARRCGLPEQDRRCEADRHPPIGPFGGCGGRGHRAAAGGVRDPWPASDEGVAGLRADRQPACRADPARPPGDRARSAPARRRGRRCPQAGRRDRDLSVRPLGDGVESFGPRQADMRLWPPVNPSRAGLSPKYWQAKTDDTKTVDYETAAYALHQLQLPGKFPSIESHKGTKYNSPQAYEEHLFDRCHLFDHHNRHTRIEN